MLRANDIVPQEKALDASPTPETSSGKGKHSKTKREIESGSEIEDDDEDSESMREKALLVRFQVRFYVVNY
jgi:hypothetical protein